MLEQAKERAQRRADNEKSPMVDVMDEFSPRFKIGDMDYGSMERENGKKTVITSDMLQKKSTIFGSVSMEELSTPIGEDAVLPRLEHKPEDLNGIRPIVPFQFSIGDELLL